MTDTVRGPRIFRPSPSARWEYQHRWGSFPGDVTTYSAQRNLNGSLTIRNGSESVEIRSEVVPFIAEMVAAAAIWTDGDTDA